jgi:putative CocE/NonD family hydrolase
VRTGRVGRIDVGLDHWSFDRVQRFMDHWLRHEDNGVGDDPPVNVFVVGSNRWCSADAWPLPGTTTLNLYLHSRANAASDGGVLGIEAPAHEPADTFVYDPDSPVTYWLTRSLWDMASQLDDRRPLEARQDVLVYSTEPLAAGLEVVGPLSAVLYASTSAPDTDFTAALVDVFPDGHAQLVQEGIVRLSSLDNGHSVAARIADAARRLTIDMCATAHLFAPGHRVRLEVSSSNFGRYDRNLNTGHPFGLDADRARAVQSILHDHRRPSHLALPVIPAER